MAKPNIWLPSYIKRDSPEPEYYGHDVSRSYEVTNTLINDTIAGDTATQYIWIAGWEVSVTPGSGAFNVNLVFTNVVGQDSNNRILYNLYEGANTYAGGNQLWQVRYPRPKRQLLLTSSVGIIMSAGGASSGLASLIVHMYSM